MLLIQNQNKQQIPPKQTNKTKPKTNNTPPETQQQTRHLQTAGSEVTDFCLHKYFDLSKVQAKDLPSSDKL